MPAKLKDPQISVSLTIKFEVSPKMSLYFHQLLNRKCAQIQKSNSHLHCIDKF